MNNYNLFNCNLDMLSKKKYYNYYNISKIKDITFNSKINLNEQNFSLINNYNILKIVSKSKPIVKKSKKSISNFQLRKGDNVGIISNISNYKSLFKVLNYVRFGIISNIPIFYEEYYYKNNINTNSINIVNINNLMELNYLNIIHYYSIQMNTISTCYTCIDHQILLSSLNIPIKFYK